jgi:Uma2 family endonuclease
MTQAATILTASTAGVRYPTATDRLHALGDAPLGQILFVFDPMPDSATEADVLRWADGEPRKLVELIDGTLVEKAVEFEESEIAIHIGYLLKGFLRPRRLGRIAGADVTIRLRSRGVRIPDVGFYD